MSNLNGRSPASLIGQSTPGITFWTIFAILMAFGLPILIHSNQGDWKYNYNRLLIYGYLYESRGAGWRYLAFWHPYVISPIMGLIYLLIMIFMQSFIAKPASSDRLLLYGKAVEATIVNSQETGLTVNDLPQIIITVEFLDNNKTIIASFKKLYSILNLSSISVGSKINILYDAQNPNIIEPNE